MVEYNIVKYCKKCNTRFLVGKGESKKYYCDECYPIIAQQRKEQQRDE